jgi:hypothetical protein
MAIIEGLKREGINVQSTKEAGNLGAKDEEQFEYANTQKACIFTHDDDFLKIAAKWHKEGREHYGVIYISQQRAHIGHCIKRIKLLWDKLSSEDMKNHIEFL